MFINPGWGLPGGGIITERPGFEKKAWGEILVNNKGKEEFIAEVESKSIQKFNKPNFLKRIFRTKNR